MIIIQTKTLVRFAILFTAVVALIVFAVSATTQVKADDGISLETIAGTWAVLGSGEFGQALGPFVAGTPIVTEGLFFFEEDGSCDVSNFTNVGGLTAPSTPLTDCTVVVNPDGTGTMTQISASPLSPFIFDFVIADEDKMFAITEGPAVLSLTMERQDDDD